MRKLKSRNHISKMVFSPDSRYLFAIGGKSTGVSVWDLQKGKVTQKFYMPESLSRRGRTVRDLAFCLPNKLILGGDNGVYPLYVWDWPCEPDAVPTELAIQGHRFTVRSVQNQTLLLVETFDELNSLWYPVTGQVQQISHRDWHSLSNADFNHNGLLFAWINYNQLMILSTIEGKILDYEQDALKTINVSMSAYLIRFHPSQNTIAVSANMQIQVYNALTGKSIAPTLEHEKSVHAMEYTPDGTKLLSICGGGQLHIWNANTHAKITSYDFGLGALSCLAVAPDGLTCAIGGQFQEIVVVDLDS